MASTSEGPTCCICFDIYDQELARAFTGPCGHSICAQCEFKLRIACMKKGIPAQCWTCMKPFDGPLYRTYALESATPRTEEARFPNPYMTNSQARQQLINNPELYKDIHLPNYTPPDGDTDSEDIEPPPPLLDLSSLPRSSASLLGPPLPLFQRRLNTGSMLSATAAPTYSGYYATTSSSNNNNNSHRHHPYRTIPTNRITSLMPCYPAQQYLANPNRCPLPPPPQYHHHQLPTTPQSFYSYIESMNSITIPPTTVALIPAPGYPHYVSSQMWQPQPPQLQLQQHQQQQQNNNNNYGNYPQM